MDDDNYFSEWHGDISSLIGQPLRTNGCIVILCTAGCAVAECDYVRRPIRRDDIAVIFSDTLFSLAEVSATFGMRMFGLSTALSDEATFITSGPFFDWIDEHRIIHMPGYERNNINQWLNGLDWIKNNTGQATRRIMLHNHWQNFFLAFEALVKPQLNPDAFPAISAPRRIFSRFLQLVAEHCHTHHDVKFYADSLCITPFYLSKVTNNVYHTTPKEIIDRQLIMEIKVLLTGTDLSVKEIAHRYQFGTPSYLTRFFSRHTGLTPLAFRRLHT